MKRIFAILGIALAIASFNACNDVEEVFVETTGISLAKSTLSIYPGDFVALESDMTPGNASSTYKTWSSSNTAIATVDNWGRVFGVAPGDAVITVKTASGGYTASCKVTVVPIAETAVSLSAEELTVYYDETETISATVAPDNASYKTVTWTSANPEIASINESGQIKGVNLGTTTITATTRGGLTAVCKVTVAVRMPTSAETVVLWKADRAGFRGLYGAAADEGKSAGKDGWLKFENGAATWSQNTTGNPRTATLTLSTGSSITVNQMDAADLAGDYDFFSNAFKSLDNTTNLGTRRMKTAVSLVAVDEVETINGHEHNLDLVGMYYDFKLPVSVEFTENGPQLYFYLSLDYQTVSTGAEVAIIPELTNSATYSTGYFAPKTFADGNDYFWARWDLMDVFSAPMITMPAAEDRLVSDSRYMCGFSIVTKGYAEGSYTTIYQLNYNNIWAYDGTGGSYFSKK